MLVRWRFRAKGFIKIHKLVYIFYQLVEYSYWTEIYKKSWKCWKFLPDEVDHIVKAQAHLDTSLFLCCTSNDTVCSYLSSWCEFVHLLRQIPVFYIFPPTLVDRTLCVLLPPMCLCFRWLEPSSSSQLTECCRCAAWRKSTACPTTTEIGLWSRRGGTSDSASISPTATRTPTCTSDRTGRTAWTTARAAAASSGGYTTGNTQTPWAAAVFLRGWSCVCVSFVRCCVEAQNITNLLLRVVSGPQTK